MREKVTNLHEHTNHLSWRHMAPRGKNLLVNLAKRIASPPSVALVALVGASLLYVILHQIIPFTSFWTGMILVVIISPIVAYPLGHALTHYSQVLEKKHEELYANNEIKNRLIYILSHDIKSPLNNIQQTLRLVSNGYVNPEEFRGLSNDLYSDVDRTLNLTNNLISWINVQQNDFKPDKVTFDINKVMSETIDLYKPIAERKGIMIEMTSEEGLTINSDPEMWKIVLRNLISNAIKFTNSEGFVHLGIKSDAKEILCWISDNGVGIKAQKLPGILSEGYMESELGTENEKGTGLGLNLVKNVMNKLQGDISVESKENVGTTFYFSIPNTA